MGTICEFTDRGGYSENQDASFTLSLPGAEVWAVFDGHGKEHGFLAATTAAASMRDALITNGAELVARPAAVLDAAFARAHADVLAAMRVAEPTCVAVGGVLLRTAELADVDDGAPPWEALDGGATATVCVLLRAARELVVASCGDSSAMIFSDAVEAAPPPLPPAHHAPSAARSPPPSGAARGAGLMCLPALEDHTPVNAREFVRVRGSAEGRLLRFVYDAPEPIPIWSEGGAGDGGGVGSPFETVASESIASAAALFGFGRAAASAPPASSLPPLPSLPPSLVPLLTAPSQAAIARAAAADVLAKNVRGELHSLVLTPDGHVLRGRGGKAYAVAEQALTMTRSLGDCLHHAFGVTEHPEVVTLKLDGLGPAGAADGTAGARPVVAASAATATAAAAHERAPMPARPPSLPPILVLASDGLWDALEPSAVTLLVEPIAQRLRDGDVLGARRAAHELCERARVSAAHIFGDAADNMTILIAALGETPADVRAAPPRGERAARVGAGAGAGAVAERPSCGGVSVGLARARAAAAAGRGPVSSGPARSLPHSAVAGGGLRGGARGGGGEASGNGNGSDATLSATSSAASTLSAGNSRSTSPAHPPRAPASARSARASGSAVPGAERDADAAALDTDRTTAGDVSASSSDGALHARQPPPDDALLLEGALDKLSGGATSNTGLRRALGDFLRNWERRYFRLYKRRGSPSAILAYSRAHEAETPAVMLAVSSVQLLREVPSLTPLRPARSSPNGRGRTGGVGGGGADVNAPPPLEFRVDAVGRSLTLRAPNERTFRGWLVAFESAGARVLGPNGSPLVMPGAAARWPIAGGGERRQPAVGGQAHGQRDQPRGARLARSAEDEVAPPGAVRLQTSASCTSDLLFT